MPESYPFDHHPCWSEYRKSLWERIHLPIAKTCNLRCAFCDQKNPGACHTSNPGASRQIMDSKSALERLEKEIKGRPRLKIVAVSGPGDPLFKSTSLDFLKEVRKRWSYMKLCLSTNGTYVPQ